MLLWGQSFLSSLQWFSKQRHFSNRINKNTQSWSCECGNSLVDQVNNHTFLFLLACPQAAAQILRAITMNVTLLTISPFDPFSPTTPWRWKDWVLKSKVVLNPSETTVKYWLCLFCLFVCVFTYSSHFSSGWFIIRMSWLLLMSADA